MTQAPLTEVVARTLELTMQAHLPVRLPDDTVMCLCHSQDNEALFVGPVFHRQHVAKEQLAALAALAPCERCGGSGWETCGTCVGAGLCDNSAENGVGGGCVDGRVRCDCNGTGKSKNLAIFPVSGEVRLVEQVGWAIPDTKPLARWAWDTVMPPVEKFPQWEHLSDKGWSPLYTSVPLEQS